MKIIIFWARQKLVDGFPQPQRRRRKEQCIDLISIRRFTRNLWIKSKISDFLTRFAAVICSGRRNLKPFAVVLYDNDL